MSLPNNAGEYILDASKLAPSAAATTVVSAGYSLQDWVAICTIVYTVMMALHLLYKFARERAEDRVKRRELLRAAINGS